MKVFISHSYKNESLAQKIAEILKKAGLDVWDGREILPGDNWADKVSHALNESDAMVVLLTSDSLKSRSVRHEIEFALGEKRFRRRLIPVLVGSPDKFSGEDFPWILNHLKTVKLTESENNEEDLKQITQALFEDSSDTATTKS
ncbi:toll/interleukin-1 receptor domain-containing protein [candidate division KSB1 bacterium]|nr:toll/interleukin-1 receptor domain-containing protein [candidate division KSB1 bacterium]